MWKVGYSHDTPPLLSPSPTFDHSSGEGGGGSRGEGGEDLPSPLGFQQGSESWRNVHSEGFRLGQVVPSLGCTTSLARHIREQEMEAGALAGGPLVFLGRRQCPIQGFRRLAEPAHGCEQLAETLQGSGVMRYQAGQSVARTFFQEGLNQGGATILSAPIGSDRLDNALFSEQDSLFSSNSMI